MSTTAGSDVAEADAMSATPSAALEALLAHIPESHRDACRPELGKPEDGVVVSLRSEVSPDLDISYVRLDSAVALAARYRRALESAGIPGSTGDCSEAVPGEEPYPIGGEPGGRLLCEEALGSISFTWTHEPTLIQATAFYEGALADVWEWWQSESGPIG